MEYVAVVEFYQFVNIFYNQSRSLSPETIKMTCPVCRDEIDPLEFLQTLGQDDQAIEIENPLPNNPPPINSQPNIPLPLNSSPSNLSPINSPNNQFLINPPNNQFVINPPYNNNLNNPYNNNLNSSYNNNNLNSPYNNNVSSNNAQNDLIRQFYDQFKK